jgi:hypothetical protein
MNWVELLAKQSQARLTLWGFLLVALIGGMDYIAPPDVTTFIFYLIPILFATWFVNKWIGVRVQDIVNSCECPFYLGKGSGHRKHCQAVE